jgi:hypothetical protein
MIFRRLKVKINAHFTLRGHYFQQPAIIGKIVDACGAPAMHHRSSRPSAYQSIDFIILI